MSTTTSMKMKVNLLEQAITYTCNCLLQLAYRIEGGRIVNGHYMADLHSVVERGFRAWLSEQTLRSVFFELYDPRADQAYERGEVSLEYTANPKEKAVAPPVEELEALFRRLEKLPPGAQFRVVVRTDPGACHVEGWGPTTLKELMGGVKEIIEVGTGHGYGNIWAKLGYHIANWNKRAQERWTHAS